MRKGDFKEASNRWEIVCDKFPKGSNGYLGGGKAYIELQDYTKAENLCKHGLKVIGRKTPKVRDLYYCLIESLLKQHGRAKECINFIVGLEQTYSGNITDGKYYKTIANALFYMLGRDKEKIDSQSTDFIIIRLLNEPLYYSNYMPWLNCLLFTNPQLSLSYYEGVLQSLKDHISNVIKKENITNPMAVLVSSLSTDEQRISAHLKIIREDCYHSVQLCLNQPENKKALESACNITIKNGYWKSLKPSMIFSFARSVVFVDQDKGDKFISEVYELYKNRNLPVSDPIGLLCHRHTKRQALLETVSKRDDIDGVNGRKLNIAICIGGQLRGFKGNLKLLINALGIDKHHYRVFVHTWKNIGRKFPSAPNRKRAFSGEFSNAYYECFVNRPGLQEYLKRQYPNFYNLLIYTSFASLDALKDEYQTSDIVIENEEDEIFSSWDNQKKMHYKIYAAHELAVKSGDKFDLMIRIRPDLKRECEGSFDLVKIYQKSKSDISIFVGSGFIPFWDLNFCIDDNFAIGIPEAMGVYANTFIDFAWHEKNNTFSRNKQFNAHRTQEHNLFCNGVHVDKFQQKITGPFQDPEKVSSNDIYDALCTDVKDRTLTDEDRLLLDACKKDLETLN